MKKESFLIYKEWYPIIKSLSDESLGKIFRAVFQYQIDGKVSDLEESTPEFMAFQFFRNQFDRDLQKYEDRCRKNSDNIRKRWNSNDTNEFERIESNTNNTDKEKDKEREKEKEDDKEKEDELIFPFSDDFRKIWSGWLEYKKKEFKFQYKTVKSEQMAINQLDKLSGGDENLALKIIEQSIVNGWKGLFSVKINQSDKKEERREQTIDHLEDIKRRLS